MANISVKNILFVQDTAPCIRTIKIGTALSSKKLKIHIAYRDKTPNEVYGYGNDSFKTLIKLPQYSFRDKQIIGKLIEELNIDLIHFHNEPDKLGAKLINAKYSVPVIYDQHDFMSFKKRLSNKEKKNERVCNEQADGTVYITKSYKKEVSKYYRLIDNSIIFGNYFPKESTLNEKDFHPKLSDTDNKCHLVYLGRISEAKTEHRNILKIIKQLSNKDFVIHIYPSRDKAFKLYKKIKNVYVHNKLPYKELIKEISKYDFGLTIFNETIASKLPHIKYAMGNKSYDYLCAGIPIVVQNCLDEAKEFVLGNKFGFVMENFSEYKNLSKESYNNLVDHIIQNRKIFAMEYQINRVIDFYEKTKELFDEQKSFNNNAKKT